MFSYFAPVIVSLVLQWFQLINDPFLYNPPAVRAPDTAPVVTRASRYGGPKDGRWGGAALAAAPDHHIEAGMHVCAHRTLKFGTILVVQSVRTRRTTLCRVMDRGPYGAIDANGVWHVEIRLQPGSRRRGDLDLAFTAYNAIGLKGIAPVRFWEAYAPEKPMRIRPKRRGSRPAT